MVFPYVNTKHYVCEEPSMTEDILFETSLNQLIAQTERGFPATTKRQNATDTVSVSDIQLIPQKDKLLIKGQVRGSGNKIYDTTIQFLKVKYNPPEGTDKVTFIANEQSYDIATININQTDCKVRCTCLDFRFRFALYNFSDGSLYGSKPPAYQGKSDSPRGPANATKTPGVCKHIITFVNELHNANLFV